MELFYTWLALAAIQAAATISPGPAFAITLRNAVQGDRMSGILTSIGLGLGVGLHILFVIFGIAVLVAQSEILYNIVKYSGAAYLIYIGAKAIMAKPRAKGPKSIDSVIKNPSPLRRIQNGFWTNVLNPKALVFFTAVYAQFITPETPWEISTLYGFTSVFIEVVWFSLVTIFLTTQTIRTKFLNISHWIERVCGGLLIALGVKLAVSKI